MFGKKYIAMTQYVKTLTQRVKNNDAICQTMFTGQCYNNSPGVY